MRWLLSVLLFVVASCAERETTYYHIYSTNAAEADGDAWTEALIGLFQHYTDGACGDEMPIIEDFNIYTPSCGLSEEQLAEELAFLPPGSWAISIVRQSVYARTIERSERMVLRRH